MSERPFQAHCDRDRKATVALISADGIEVWVCKGCYQDLHYLKGITTLRHVKSDPLLESEIRQARRKKKEPS